MLFKWKSNNGNLLNPYMCFLAIALAIDVVELMLLSGTFYAFIDKLLSFNSFFTSPVHFCSLLKLFNCMIIILLKKKQKWVDSILMHIFLSLAMTGSVLQKMRVAILGRR